MKTSSGSRVFLAAAVLAAAEISAYSQSVVPVLKGVQSTSMKKVVEIRSYTLKPGVRATFHKLVVEKAAPMLKRWSIEVVALGPSLHDADSYFLIRAYNDLNHRQQSEDAFYASEEWRKGPREEILSLIKEYTTIVFEADPILLQRLGGLSFSLEGAEILHE